MIKNQKGFTGLEVVLIVLLVAIVAAAGGYVYSQRNQAQNNSKEESVRSPEEINGEEAATFVEKFYDEYKSISADNVESAEQQSKAVVEKYGTSELVSYYSNAQGYDPIFCGQNLPNGKITASVKSSSGENVVVSVSQNYIGEAGDPQGDSSIKNTAVVVKQGDSLKIKSIECPNPEPATN